MKNMLVCLLLLLLHGLPLCWSCQSSSSAPLPSCPPPGDDSSVILQLGHPMLKIACEKIDDCEIHSSSNLAIRDRLHKVLKDFQSKHNFGRAIAAPQIGHNIQMIAMKLSTHEPSVTLYNPEIIAQSPETITMWDDCFSFPDLMVKVERYKTICVKFTNDAGEEKIWHCDDTALAELLQHEIDHLRGVLAVDRALPDIEGCKSIINRLDWIKNKKFYNTFVDYSSPAEE